MEYEYPVEVGDAVMHYRDSSYVGKVVHIDRNLPHPTTCLVKWEDCFALDMQWTNKLIVCSAAEIKTI